jgi:hypothetical protein
MSDCQKFRDMIQDFIAGELPQAERGVLQAHLDSCSECSGLIEFHLELSQAPGGIPEPSERDLLVMRRSVLAQISRTERLAAERSPGWDLRALTRLHPAMAVPAAAVLIIVGVLVGRLSFGQDPPGERYLLQEMDRQAARQAGVSDYWDTPLTYTNVAVRPLSGGRLDMSFDVCRHMNIVTPMDSPLAKDVLLHAILTPSTMGAKMKAMSLTPEILDPKLREALVFTLHNDPNLAVRLEAFAVVTRYPYDAVTEEALLKTLRQDEAVQMRLLALEFLAEREVDPETLQQTIRSAKLESDPAILQRAVTLTADYQ